MNHIHDKHGSRSVEGTDNLWAVQSSRVANNIIILILIMRNILIITDVESWFYCDNLQMDNGFLCDGKPDCWDKKDELGCHCEYYQVFHSTINNFSCFSCFNSNSWPLRTHFPHNILLRFLLFYNHILF